MMASTPKRFWANRSRQADSSAPADTQPESGTEKNPQGKKGPTPRRKDREAENLRPLVPADRKEAERQARAQMRQRQQEAREGVARGDEQFLRESERGPQKKFVRDTVDARFTFGEFLIPVMLIVLLLNFYPDPRVAVVGFLVTFIGIGIALIEGVILGAVIRKRIGRVVGPDAVERGIILATVARCMQIRRMRLPRPQVRRGERIEFRK